MNNCTDPIKSRFESGHYIFLYPAALLLAWVGAWLMDLLLRAYFHWSVALDTFFWIAMKIVIWVVPVLFLIHSVQRNTLAQFLGFHHTSRGLLWGGLAGIALTGINFVVTALPSGAKLHIPSLSLVLLNTIVVAPLVEEIALRGFLLQSLQLKRVPFWMANIVTAVTFVLTHFPGWYFQGKLLPLMEVARPILFLTTLGLLFGWLKRRSGSLYAALLPHALNNIYSSFLIQT